MTDYKLMPMEPTEEVLDAIRFRVGSIDRDEADEIYYLIMTTSPDVQRHPATPSFLEYPSFEESANFDPVPDVQGEMVMNNTLTKSEREHLLHALSCIESDLPEHRSVMNKLNPQPELLTVDVLVEAIEQIIKAAPSRGPLWHGSEQIVEARSALRYAEIVLAALAYHKGSKS